MADGIHIDDRELRAMSKRLDALARKFPQVVDSEIGKWAREMRRTLKSTPYPAPPHDSTYTRTGRLANSWSVQRANGWAIRNSAPYAGWVVGDKQARIHRNRWWKAKNVIRRGLKTLRDRVRAAIREKA